MHVQDLVGRLSAAAGEPDGMRAVRAVMEDLAGDIDGVTDALSWLSGTGGNALQAFYRAPNLSMLKVQFPNGRRTPPHNHGTWATILLLHGEERNTLYKRAADGSLTRVAEKVLTPGTVLPMMADTVHVAECMGAEPAIGLHVYGANVLGTDRQMWDPETLEEHTLDWSVYESFARRASAMDGAP